MDSTPLRHVRVPLTSLNPNINPNASFSFGSSSPTKMMMQSPLQKMAHQSQTMQTRTPPETEVKKRTLGAGVQSSPTTSRAMPPQVPQVEEGEERAVKKPRLSYSNSRSPSPAPSHTSSVFSSPSPATNSHDNINEHDDTNENDISQATTTLTIPDLPPVAVPEQRTTSTTRPRLTREQARQKAEILRLRLGLADYKVKTGQTDVSLDQLERRHMLRQWGQQSQPRLQQQPQRPSSYQQQQQQQQQHYRQHSPQMMHWPPSKEVTRCQHQRGLSGAGVGVGIGAGAGAGFVSGNKNGDGNWREGLWEVMRRREGERQAQQLQQMESQRGEGQQLSQEDRGDETEDEGELELELPRLPQRQLPTSPLQEGDNRGVAGEAVSGLLSLARG